MMTREETVDRKRGPRKGSGVSEPETDSQAMLWEMTCSLAADYGLCRTCAAQLAWGHQNGFSTVHAPCANCAHIVATLPTLKVNGWRTVKGRASRRADWPPTVTTDPEGTTVPEMPTVTVEAAIARRGVGTRAALVGGVTR